MDRSVTRSVAALALIGTVTAAGQGLSPPADHIHQHATPATARNDAASEFTSLHGMTADFELVDANEELVRDEDFRGRYVLVAFGFTHCTDVCPLMAFSIANALASSARDAVGVFISVDTERDTAAINHRYARGFHERMVGLGGSYEQVNAAASNFRVSYAVTKTQSSYTVQHTSHIYLIDPRGALADVFAFSTPPAEIAAAMQ